MNSFFVLSFFFYVFFCVAPVTSGSDLAQPNWALLRAGNSTWPVSQPGWGFTSPCPLCPAAKCSFNFAQSSLDAGPTSQPPTYKGLIQDLWGLALSDVETSFSAVYLSFQDSWVHTADSLSRGFEIAFQRLCWLAIYVWYSVLRVLIVTIARFIMNNYILALAGGSLFVCTALLVKMVRWICGQLPIYLVFTFPISVGRWIFQRRSWGKFSRNYAEEKCCEQFLSFTINQDPPKKCQLVFQKEDGKHAGYGTCVRLFNGTNGLLTAYHVASNSSKVVSTRTGNKIPLSQFKPLIVSPLYDQVLYAGPTEWESLLGCKGVNFAPAKTLGASKCNIYHIQKDGKWGCTNAEIEGQLKHRDLTMNGTKPTEIRDALPGQLSVLSNTEPGQSGAGYFNGKTLVAIHVGGSLEREDSDATYNVAVPVLPKPGLTSPHYVFETTAPTSGVYDSKIFKALDEAVEQAERWVKMKLSKGETLWADLEDEFPYETETKKTAKAPLSSSSSTETFHDCTEQSGNEKRGSDRGTTGKTASNPGNAASATPVKDMPTGEQIMKMLVEKIASNINLKEVEKASVEAIRAQALKKPSRSSRRRRNKNGGNNGLPKQATTAVSSTPNSTGKYTPPNRRKSPASGSAAKPPNGTTPNKNKKVDGGKRSAGNIPSWVRKPTGSAGPSSAQKLN
uniref:P1 protein n=1 Tax=Phasey bean mild yellows virus TaxID=1756832 RepID=A0A8A6LWQ3_9VIRU|nr:P1 protein [Phasey bean mild yellows virus]